MTLMPRSHLRIFGRGIRILKPGRYGNIWGTFKNADVWSLLYSDFIGPGAMGTSGFF